MAATLSLRSRSFYWLKEGMKDKDGRSGREDVGEDERGREHSERCGVEVGGMEGRCHV